MTTQLHNVPMYHVPPINQLLAERAKRGMLAFVQRLRTGYLVGVHHKAVCTELDRFMRGEIKRLMIFIPPVPLLVSLGLTHVKSDEGLMPGERYVAYMSGPCAETTPDLQVVLWNDGTVQIVRKSSGWGFTSYMGPFQDEGHFLLQLLP